MNLKFPNVKTVTLMMVEQAEMAALFYRGSLGPVCC